MQAAVKAAYADGYRVGFACIFYPPRADSDCSTAADAVQEILAAFEESKSPIDYERLRLALQAAVKAAYADGYRVGFAAAEYDDTR